MHLHDALRQIAAAGGLNADELISYADEDNIGGRDTWHGERFDPRFPPPETDWAGMSVFADEGKIIYALIRAMKPDHLLEIGVDSGGTTTHILTALHRNERGFLTSCDIKPDVGVLIPHELRTRWALYIGDALTLDFPKPIDFVLEDGPHTFQWTRDMLTRLKSYAPRVILSHDAVTHLTYPDGFAVLPAFKAALGVDSYVLTNGSIAGLAYWFNEERNG